MFLDCHVAFEVLLMLFIELEYEMNEFKIFYIKGEIVVVVIWLSRTLIGLWGENEGEKKKVSEIKSNNRSMQIEALAMYIYSLLL